MKLRVIAKESTIWDLVKKIKEVKKVLNSKIEKKKILKKNILTKITPGNNVIILYVDAMCMYITKEKD